MRSASKSSSSSKRLLTRQRILKYVVLPVVFFAVIALFVGTMSLLLTSSSSSFDQHQNNADVDGAKNKDTTNSQIMGLQVGNNSKDDEGEGKGKQHFAGDDDDDNTHRQQHHHTFNAPKRNGGSATVTAIIDSDDFASSIRNLFTLRHDDGTEGNRGASSGGDLDNSDDETLLTQMCSDTEDRRPPITNGLLRDDIGEDDKGGNVGEGEGGGLADGAGEKSTPSTQGRRRKSEELTKTTRARRTSSSTRIVVDDAYEAVNDEVELADLYTSVHCINGETAGGGGGGESMDAAASSTFYSSSSSSPPTPPFFGPSHTYGFNIVNRSCFFTNVLYRNPQRFYIFLPDTQQNRKLHKEGLLVPSVSLASRPYDGLSGKKKKMVAHSYDYRPTVVFGPIPGRAERMLNVLAKRLHRIQRTQQNQQQHQPASQRLPTPTDTHMQLVKEVQLFQSFLQLYAKCDVATDSVFSSQEPLRSMFYDKSGGGNGASSSSSQFFLAKSEAEARQLKSRREEYCAFINSLPSSSSSSPFSFPRPSCAVIAYYTPIVAPWNYAHTLFCDLFGLFWAGYEFVFAGHSDIFNSLQQQEQNYGQSDDSSDGFGGGVKKKRWHWHVGSGSDVSKAVFERSLQLVAASASSSMKNKKKENRNEGEHAEEIGNDFVPLKYKSKRDSAAAAAAGSTTSIPTMLSHLVGLSSSFQSSSPTVNGRWSSVTNAISSTVRGLWTVETNPPTAEHLWHRSKMLLRGRERRHTPMSWEGVSTTSATKDEDEVVRAGAAHGNFNGFEHVGGSSSSSSSSSSSRSAPSIASQLVASILDESVPRPDFKVVATSNHYANAFELPNKNKAFEMFSRYEHDERVVKKKREEALAGGGGGSSKKKGSQSSAGAASKNDDNGVAEHNDHNPLLFKGAIYDRDLIDNTLYRGLLVGIGTKSWSWVTDRYSASGNGHVWYSFRQHLFDVTGAVVGGGYPLSEAEKEMLMLEEEAEAEAKRKKRAAENSGGAGEAAAGDQNNKLAAASDQRPQQNRRQTPHLSSSPLRVSICHKKDKRGVVNYEETLHILEKHFAPLLDTSNGNTTNRNPLGGIETATSPHKGSSVNFNIDFVLEAAVGKSATKQIEMMDKADVFMCNEGTLATSMFLLGPGSVFISLPLVYHMAHMHRMKMPDVERWWQEPDLLRPDPRKNTGGNIDWFPQSIPWVRTFWYDAVPLNETRIQTPLKGLRNYMPEWNIIIQEERVVRLFEKVFGYLVSQKHPKMKGLADMLDRVDGVDGGLSGDNKDDTAKRREELLLKIRYWRDVFNVRKQLKKKKKKTTTEAKMNKNGDAADDEAAVIKRLMTSAETVGMARGDGTLARHSPPPPQQQRFKAIPYYLQPVHPSVPIARVRSLDGEEKSSVSSPPSALASLAWIGGEGGGGGAVEEEDDADHNYSVNARLCKGILAATPNWAAAFNGVRCLYGMSWLCEFWTNTRFQSRVLHPKWEKSGGRCGDVRTTVAEANKILSNLLSASSSDSSPSSASSSSSLFSIEAAKRYAKSGGLVDPRSNVVVSSSLKALLEEERSVSGAAMHEAGITTKKAHAQLLKLLNVDSDPLRFDGGGRGGHGDASSLSINKRKRMAALIIAAQSPFLFSSTSDYPRPLDAFLFYDPKIVQSIFGTTDIKMKEIDTEELVSIFGKERIV